MDLLVIIKVKVLVLIKWSYRSPQLCWLLNWECLGYFEHLVQRFLFYSHPRTPFRIPMKSEFPVINCHCLTRSKKKYFCNWINTWGWRLAPSSLGTRYFIWKMLVSISINMKVYYHHMLGIILNILSLWSHIWVPSHLDTHPTTQYSKTTCRNPYALTAEHRNKWESTILTMGVASISHNGLGRHLLQLY